MPESLLRDGGAVAGGLALMAQVWTYIKARIEKAERRSEIRAVILEVVNPPLIAKEMSGLRDDIAELKEIVRSENADAITRASIEAMKEGFRLGTKDVRNG
jgi:hypothetical protein